MVKAKCDYCQREFEIDAKAKTIERDIELTYFVCPHCQHEYRSFYTNAKIRTRQEKIKELWAKARKTFNSEKYKSIIKRIDELVELNKQEMNELRKRFEAEA